jgi:hypothetical protein
VKTLITKGRIMKKFLLTLVAAVLLTTSVEAKGFNRPAPINHGHNKQVVMMNSHHRAQGPQVVHHYHKKSSNKDATVALGVIGTVFVLASVLN